MGANNLSIDQEVKQHSRMVAPTLGTVKLPNFRTRDKLKPVGHCLINVRVGVDPDTREDHRR